MSSLKMASDSEERCYSSPPKRMKFDESSLLLSGSSVEIDSVPFTASNKCLESPLESKYTLIF